MLARTRHILPAVAVAAALAIGGCGRTTRNQRPRLSPTAAGGRDRDFAYAPEDLTVPAGTEVTFTNSDDAPHTATADDGSFDTDTLKAR